MAQFGKYNKMVTHPGTNISNCCLTSKVMPLAFYHSAIGKGQNSGGDLNPLSCIFQCLLVQPSAKQSLFYVLGKAVAL